MVLQSGHARTRNEVMSFLAARARDIGAQGPDNDSGVGLLLLGSPVSTATPTETPSNTSTATPAGAQLTSEVGCRPRDRASQTSPATADRQRARLHGEHSGHVHRALVVRRGTPMGEDVVLCLVDFKLRFFDRRLSRHVAQLKQFIRREYARYGVAQEEIWVVAYQVLRHD